ncbi:hypothetical protein PoB_004992600 [Plakobranchus ocellatus]|uniref:Uncharacterized protein n=1 Tax=Plakobranchus ocellatus TaxID=259542 RepID=A0AAV4BSI9_9GAST|nr:hypothetical protein PoB_004992600 [Plakobranchus ocellatus]
MLAWSKCRHQFGTLDIVVFRQDEAVLILFGDGSLCFGSDDMLKLLCCRVPSLPAITWFPGSYCVTRQLLFLSPSRMDGHHILESFPPFDQKVTPKSFRLYTVTKASMSA